MLRLIRKVALLPIITIIGAIIGLFLVLIGTDSWPDFWAELKLMIHHHWDAC